MDSDVKLGIITIAGASLISAVAWVFTDDAKNAVYIFASVVSLFLSIYATFFKGRKRGPVIVLSRPFEIRAVEPFVQTLGVISNFGDTNTVLRIHSEQFSVALYSSYNDFLRGEKTGGYAKLPVGNSLYIALSRVPKEDDRVNVDITYIDKDGKWTTEQTEIIYTNDPPIFTNHQNL